MNRIYIIDTDSNIHGYNSQMLTSYKALNQDVDLYFPDLDASNTFQGNEEFANYWTLPLDADDSTNIEDLLS